MHEPSDLLHRWPSEPSPPSGQSIGRNLGARVGSRLQTARETWLFQVLLLIALWIALHPYQGVIHDARLYLMQAINERGHRLGNDLFFAYGSQDEFTLFPFIYKFLVAALGPSTAHVAADTAGQITWFASMLFFTRAIFGPGWPSTVASAGILLLNPFYDVTTFRYGEYFATPRLFAEPLVMVALALAYRGRMSLAALSLAVATALHPLAALPGIGVVALLAAIRDKRLWLIYAIALGAGLLLAGIGIEPFRRAFARFDSVWFDAVYRRCSYAFITAWPWYAFIGPAANAAVLVMAWKFAGAQGRRLIGAVSVVAAGGIAVTLLGADLARDVLIVNLQLARALWVLAVFSNAWAAVLALRLPAGWFSRKLVLVALATQAIFTAGQFPIPIPSVIFVIALIVFLWEMQTREPLRLALRSAAWLAAIPVLMVAAVAAYIWVSIRTARPEFSEGAVGAGVAISAAVILVLAIKQIIRPSRLSILLLMSLITTGSWAMDRREDWQKFIENPKIPPDLARFVDNTGTLYWENGVDLLWLKLDRPSYYSCSQGVGAMFFRGTAIEYQRRSVGLAGLNTLDFLQSPYNSLQCEPKRQPNEQGPKTRAQLAAACRALPDLDTIVLTTHVPDTKPAEWHAPVSEVVIRGQRPERVNTFYRYRCAELR